MVEQSDLLRELELDCPVCWRSGLRKRLARNGSYRRWTSAETRGVIYRRRCATCGASYSLLPEHLVPGHRHGRDLIAAWLQLDLQGDPFRSRAFFEGQRLLEAPADELVSWTDHVDLQSPPPRPGPSRLRSWTRTFNARARTWLAPLAVACLAAGCRLETSLVEVMSALAGVRARSDALAVALGLFSWLRGGLPDEAMLRRLLPLLCTAQASHKTPRAGPGRSGYCAIHLDLRAPPDWVPRTEGVQFP